MRFIPVLLIIVFCYPAHGQDKRPIDGSDYDSWKSLGEITQSRSGELIAYTIDPSVGDKTLYIERPDGSLKRSFDRGKSLQIHHAETFCVFLISPQYDTIRKLKLDEVPEDKHPKDSLALYWPDLDSLLFFPNVKSYKLATEGDWVAFLSSKDLRGCDVEDQPGKKKKKKKGGLPGGSTKKKRAKKGNCNCEVKTSGTTLTLFNAITGEKREIHQVIDYLLSDHNWAAYVMSEKGEKDTLKVTLEDLASGDNRISFEKKFYLINELTFDRDAKQFAFVASRDTGECKNVALYYLQIEAMDKYSEVDSNKTGMPSGWTVSQHSDLRFSDDGNTLYFGTNEIVRPEPEDSLLDTEMAKLDVWSGFDPTIQPNQLYDLPEDRKKSYLAVFYPAEKRMVQIGSLQIDQIRTLKGESASFCLGIDNKPYLIERTWENLWRSDVYLVDLRNGNAKLLQEASRDVGTLSPSGEFYVWYDPEDSSWYGKNVNGSKHINLSGQFKDNFADDMNGQPCLATARGSAGWFLKGQTEFYLVYSEWDIYLLCPEDPMRSIRFTRSPEAKIRYRLADVTHPDSIYLSASNYMIGTNNRSKQETIWQIDLINTNASAERLVTDHNIVYLKKADASERILFRRMSFTDYPELEATSMDLGFMLTKKLTRVNPAQSELNWGTVELVDWKSYSGIPLRGLLYKPENFDSKKSYPLIIYYYEMYQDDLHTYYPPRATASIIYPTEYVSNGYIVFIPDIRYAAGHPAKSAYDCVLSGTDFLLKAYSWIDSTRMGLQGQSWGGYQTAMLITMTNRYAAAMAGAPVSNMFSAYGGIRWGSGLSRMFQYEQAQSRIGATIWQRPDLYIENSPVFHLPNVKTPLLVMNNDEDGAVPWYQGIELYMGLRRLSKPVWMLNYNGDKHNLTMLANKKDLSVRMRQFFDHYLLAKPAPVWMLEGIPALEKGKNYGLELEK